ncbi:diguanylate cyclase domain-containing protein [Halalkalibacter wakoensis]|nr:diguanylate cyclase [Halalkalibacter wakoensis]
MVELSLGVATSKGEKNTISSLVDAADHAMYKAKEKSGNSYVIQSNEASE